MHVGVDKRGIFAMINEDRKEKEIQDEAINLIFDIDGTLLSDKTGKIPDSALEALAEAKKNGHLLFINTGRTVCALPKELYQFEFDGYLCGCGSYLLFHEEVLLESHIEEACGQKYIEQMRECGLDGVLEGTEDLYFPKKVSRFEKLGAGKTLFWTIGSGKEEVYRRRWILYDKILCMQMNKVKRSDFFV